MISWRRNLLPYRHIRKNQKKNSPQPRIAVKRDLDLSGRGENAMNQQVNVPSESSFPVGLVMVPAVIGTLVWMCVMVSRVVM